MPAFLLKQVQVLGEGPERQDRVLVQVVHRRQTYAFEKLKRREEKGYPKTPPILVPATLVMTNRQAAPRKMRIRPNAAASLMEPPM